MSDLAHSGAEHLRGTSTLPDDLTDDELRRAPVLASADLLVMKDLTDDEFDAFDRALRT